MATSSLEPLLESFAHRVAQRDVPPVLPVIDRFGREQVMKRLVAALAPLGPGRNHRGRLSQAHMLESFLTREAQTAADLAAAAGLRRVAGSHAHAGLVQAGLLRWAYEGPRRVYRLTRWGEDWLLAIGRAEPVPERPA